MVCQFCYKMSSRIRLEILPVEISSSLGGIFRSKWESRKSRSLVMRINPSWRQIFRISLSGVRSLSGKSNACRHSDPFHRMKWASANGNWASIRNFMRKAAGWISLSSALMHKAGRPGCPLPPKRDNHSGFLPWTSPMKVGPAAFPLDIAFLGCMACRGIFPNQWWFVQANFPWIKGKGNFVFMHFTSIGILNN